MKKYRVGVDVDGVLADFTTPVLTIVGEMLARKVSINDLPSWDIDELLPEDQRDDLWKKVGDSRLCRNLNPLPGAQEGLKMLQDKVEIFAVTSYLSHAETWVTDRDAWLKEHFNIDNKHIVHTKSKHVFSGKMLIDDKPQNILDWTEEWGHTFAIPVLWTQPYNENYKFHTNHSYKIVRTNSWENVYQLL
jgi:5'(3')-deoxyribonucleotidase